MKFGKLDDVESVDFSLPAIDSNRLGKSLISKNPSVYIGATGWSMSAWKGKWYPAKTKSSDFLSAYSKQFNSVELNSSYYAVPKESTIEKWCNNTPDDFRFFPKVPQLISRAKNPLNQLHHWEFFIHQITGFQSKLGAIFMQLSPHQGKEYCESLIGFLDQIQLPCPLHIEFRSDEIFEDKTFFDSLYSECLSRAVGIVLTDVSGKRNLLHTAVSSHQLLVRFVGNDLHPSDFTRIDEWIERIINYHTEYKKDIIFFIHEPDNVNAPDLISYLAQNLTNKAKGIILRTPNRQDNSV